MKMKNLQLQMSEEIIDMLRKEKKIQGVTMSKLVEKLIVEKYATIAYKMRNMEE